MSAVASDPHALLARLDPSRMRFGLGRTRAAMEALHHPELRYATVHIAGTNGKGSTCAFIDAALRAAGAKVGLYTSPHLSRFNERICVGGSPIDDAALAAATAEVLARIPGAVDGTDPMTYFEFATAVAFVHFARCGVDIAVVETGLGGRLDATTVISPLATAVARVGMDHVAILGSTLTDIAREKAGIFKPGVPAVLGPQTDEARAALVAAAIEARAPLVAHGNDFSASRGPDGTFAYRGRTLELGGVQLSLAGPHQAENAGLACGVLELIAKRAGLSAAHVRTGLATACWPGRLERLGGFVLDGAHNPDAARALRAAMDTDFPGPRRLVFGALGDKDWAAMARILFPGSVAIHLVRPRSSRALQPEALLRAARECRTPALVHFTVREALESASRAQKPGELKVVCGSLYLVGEAREILAG